MRASRSVGERYRAVAACTFPYDLAPLELGFVVSFGAPAHNGANHSMSISSR
jgi:hypothetical protein